VGKSTADGTTVVGKTGSGDVYAGHDGNAYKKTDDGWQKYDNGGWAPLNRRLLRVRSSSPCTDSGHAAAKSAADAEWAAGNAAALFPDVSGGKRTDARAPARVTEPPKGRAVDPAFPSIPEWRWFEKSGGRWE